MDCLTDGERGALCQEQRSPSPHTPARSPDQRARRRDSYDGRSGHAAAADDRTSRGTASAAAREQADARRYGDVGLLLGLCAPAPGRAATPDVGAGAGDSEIDSEMGAGDSEMDSDATLALLLKYTHVVGAS